MKITITYFFLSFVTLTYGQITLSGIIKSNTDEPLEYVNIGIKNKNIGTISDLNGNFTITLNNSELNEILSFSYIGYEEKQISIKDLQKSNFNEIILNESQTVLSEVIVISSKPKLVELGTKSYVSMVAGYVKANNDKNNDIQEFAKEIKINKPSKILDVNINLFNVFVDTASFRINIYDVKDNLPNNKINTQNIIIQKKVENGWNKFNVEEFDLNFEEPFFISIEYLPKQKDEAEPFRYSGQLFGKSITRSSSFGIWNIKKGLTMSMFVTVKQ
jgi:hypothetical protein